LPPRKQNKPVAPRERRVVAFLFLQRLFQSLELIERKNCNHNNMLAQKPPMRPPNAGGGDFSDKAVNKGSLVLRGATPGITNYPQLR